MWEMGEGLRVVKKGGSARGGLMVGKGANVMGGKRWKGYRWEKGEGPGMGKVEMLWMGGGRGNRGTSYGCEKGERIGVGKRGKRYGWEK